MRELNRLGITSCIDAGGGFQNYPDDYEIIRQLHQNDELTVRIAYNLFTQKPKGEKEDFARWMKMTRPGEGDDFYKVNGAGEMLVFSAADFEDFLEPRPDLPPSLEGELKDVVTMLASNRWPFRLHATYNESIERFLNVFEEVHREVPIDRLGWFFDHAETVTDRNIERIRALGAGIAIQHRMAFQGEYFVDRYGAEAARRTPPVRRMLELGVPVGAGTDATRVANYNPWNSLYWLVSGRTVGGWPCIRMRTVSAARKRCAFTPRAVPGFRTIRSARERSASASSPISPCSVKTSSPSRKSGSKASSRC